MSLLDRSYFLNEKHTSRMDRCVFLLPFFYLSLFLIK